MTSKSAKRGVTANEPDNPPRLPLRRRRSWFALAVVPLVCAAIVWFSFSEIDRRLSDRDRLSVDRVVFTGDPIQVQTIEGGTVIEMAVQPEQSVEAGQLLARVSTTPPDADGPVLVDVVSPVQATVLQTSPNGATLRAGSSLVVMYAPDELHFQARVPYDSLADIRLGMSAILTIPSVGEVETLVDRVVNTLPAPGEEPDSHVTLVLKPRSASDLAGLPPGFVLSGWIDLTSGDPDSTPTIIDARN